MAEQILQVEGLTARVEDKVILHEVGLTIKKGETHVLMGPNGAGKSTLGYVLTGNPKYSVTEGKILFKGNDITERRQTSAPRRECSCRFRNRSRCRDSPSRALSAVH